MGQVIARLRQEGFKFVLNNIGKSVKCHQFVLSYLLLVFNRFLSNFEFGLTLRISETAHLCSISPNFYQTWIEFALILRISFQQF